MKHIITNINEANELVRMDDFLDIDSFFGFIFEFRETFPFGHSQYISYSLA